MSDFFEEKRYSNAQKGTRIVSAVSAAIAASIVSNLIAIHDIEPHKRQAQKVQDSLVKANDSLQGKVIEYRSALKAYEKCYENQGK